jgi:hypothetical protein
LLGRYNSGIIKVHELSIIVYSSVIGLGQQKVARSMSKRDKFSRLAREGGKKEGGGID